MAWLSTQKRLTQVYCFVVAALNDCGIRPDGAVIKPWIREEIASIDPQPTQVEVNVALMAMWAEGVKFHGVTDDAAAKFEEHALFGKAGHKLGVAKKE
jgi:hypothetical protein